LIDRRGPIQPQPSVEFWAHIWRRSAIVHGAPFPTKVAPRSHDGDCTQPAQQRAVSLTCQRAAQDALCFSPPKTRAAHPLPSSIKRHLLRAVRPDERASVRLADQACRAPGRSPATTEQQPTRPPQPKSSSSSSHRGSCRGFEPCRHAIDVDFGGEPSEGDAPVAKRIEERLAQLKQAAVEEREEAGHRDGEPAKVWLVSEEAEGPEMVNWS
jgi:hypothetical protein